MSLLKEFDEFARKRRCRFLFDTGVNNKLHSFRTSTFINLIQRVTHLKIALIKPNYRDIIYANKKVSGYSN